jgi:hypothetical protein
MATSPMGGYPGTSSYGSNGYNNNNPYWTNSNLQGQNKMQQAKQHEQNKGLLIGGLTGAGAGALAGLKFGIPGAALGALGGTALGMGLGGTLGKLVGGEHAAEKDLADGTFDGSSGSGKQAGGH